jgi:hypothetical protein
VKTGAVIAAGILISFVLLMAALERRDQCRKNRNSTSDHHYPEDRDTTDPESYDALGGNAPKTPCKSQYPSEEKHRADEQKYWRWQILIGIFTLIFAAIAAVGAFRTYINSNESLFEARQQTTAARRQTDIAFAQLRPWVTVTPTISGNVGFGATSVNFPVELKLSNVGHAPAFDVHLVFDLKVYSSFAEIHQEKALLCKQDILVVSGLRDGIWMPPQGDPVRRFYESYVGAQIIAPTGRKMGTDSGLSSRAARFTG